MMYDLDTYDKCGYFYLHNGYLKVICKPVLYDKKLTGKRLVDLDYVENQETANALYIEYIEGNADELPYFFPCLSFVPSYILFARTKAKDPCQIRAVSYNRFVSLINK